MNPDDFLPQTTSHQAAADRGIGDIHSTAKGSGARYNNGKPDLSLIPLGMLAAYYGAGLPDDTPSIPVMVLECLGQFQAVHDAEALDLAFAILGDKAWEEGAHVFSYGKRKYAAWNWAKGMPWSVPLACAARHCVDILEGEELDPESKRPHIGHVQCNLIMLRQYVSTFPEGNDLPPVGLLKPIQLRATPLPRIDASCLRTGTAVQRLVGSEPL